MSGLPFDVESVRLLDHMPSNDDCFMPFCTTVFSMISPLRPSCASMMRTMGLAAMRRLNDFRRTSGVVPIAFSSLASDDELMPCV